MTQHIEVKPGESLMDIVLTKLEWWPEEWGQYVVAAHAGPDRGLWFGNRLPTYKSGGWEGVGAVEAWISLLPYDSAGAAVTRPVWLESSVFAKNIPAGDPVIESQATQCRYYECEVDHPQNPRQGGVPYVPNCEDIIQALGLTFDEGCEFKSLWRRGRARQGFVKAESTAVRDAQKAAHYAGRVLAFELRKANK